MTLYSKDEPFIIGIDFDGTVTTTPAGGNDFPKSQKVLLTFTIIFTNIIIKILRIQFIENEPENCHIFSVANEWL